MSNEDNPGGLVAAERGRAEAREGRRPDWLPPIDVAQLELSELAWTEGRSPHVREAILGDFAGGDGVRFSIEHRPTCYRRGPFCLLIEVAGGPDHHKWGCFDEQDQPTRYYHHESSALREAQAIANVLWKDRCKR